jgi:hypothetical protein
MDLIQENDLYQKQLAQKNMEVDKLTEAISKLRLFDNPGLELAIDARKNKDSRIRELEYLLKQNIEDKQKLEVDNRVMAERFNEIRKNNDDVISELNFIKSRESEQVSQLESKIEKLENQLQFISKENQSLRLTDEKCRHEMTQLNKLKEKYEEKYNKKKDINLELFQKVNELENELKIVLLEKSYENQEKKKDDNDKKTKIEAKHKIFEDMQSKISSYRKELIKQRMVNKLE